MVSLCAGCSSGRLMCGCRLSLLALSYTQPPHDIMHDEAMKARSAAVLDPLYTAARRASYAVV
jgi:hypothetical protein